MVCGRVAILVQGVVAQQGTIDELTAGQHRYELVVAETGDAPELLGRALPAGTSRMALPEGQAEGKNEGEALARRIGFRGSLATGESVEVERNVLRLGTEDPGLIQPIIDRVRAAGGVITSVRGVRPSLEDLFMRAVTDPVTGETLAPGADEGKKR